MVSIDTKFKDKPWGYHTTLAEGNAYKVKYLIIYPSHELSYQYHKQREEIWTVLEGRGIATINGIERLIEMDDVINIIPYAKHKVANHGNRQLIIHEVQLGDRCLEDDIIRLVDPYDRDIRT